MPRRNSSVGKRHVSHGGKIGSGSYGIESTKEELIADLQRHVSQHAKSFGVIKKKKKTTKKDLTRKKDTRDAIKATPAGKYKHDKAIITEFRRIRKQIRNWNHFYSLATEALKIPMMTVQIRVPVLRNAGLLPQIDSAKGRAVSKKQTETKSTTITPAQRIIARNHPLKGMSPNVVITATTKLIKQGATRNSRQVQALETLFLVENESSKQKDRAYFWAAIEAKLKKKKIDN